MDKLQFLVLIYYYSPVCYRSVSLRGVNGARSLARSHLAGLDEIGEHDDCAAVVLPDHSPEVVDSPWPRRLRCDVLTSRVRALHDE